MHTSFIAVMSSLSFASSNSLLSFMCVFWAFSNSSTALNAGVLVMSICAADVCTCGGSYLLHSVTINFMLYFYYTHLCPSNHMGLTALISRNVAETQSTPCIYKRVRTLVASSNSILHLFFVCLSLSHPLLSLTSFRMGPPVFLVQEWGWVKERGKAPQ